MYEAYKSPIKLIEFQQHSNNFSNTKPAKSIKLCSIPHLLISSPVAACCQEEWGAPPDCRADSRGQESSRAQAWSRVIVQIQAIWFLPKPFKLRDLHVQCRGLNSQNRVVYRIMLEGLHGDAITIATCRIQGYFGLSVPLAQLSDSASGFRVQDVAQAFRISGLMELGFQGGFGSGGF